MDLKPKYNGKEIVCEVTDTRTNLTHSTKETIYVKCEALFLRFYRIMASLDGPRKPYVPKPAVFTYDGLEVELNCMIDAYPQPDVRWEFKKTNIWVRFQGNCCKGVD